MVHLNSPEAIGIMVFYSLLTYVIVPRLALPYTKTFKDPCMVGMIIGFVISILLWHFFGKHYVYNIK